MSKRKNLDAVIREMHPRQVFRISRGARTQVRNVFVRVTIEGVTGYGEASPNAFYGESADDVLSLLNAAKPFVSEFQVESIDDIRRAWHEAWRWLAPSRAAQCALDLALWDGLARRNGVSVSELAMGAPSHPIESFCTVGLSSPAELEGKVAALHGFPLIKIKSDASADMEPVRFIRERSGARLAVDANCAWAGVDIAKVSRELAQLGVAFIEQPLPPSEDAWMPTWLTASELPIMADESCVLTGDVEHLSGRFTGFNIKLVKCGGLTPALAMWRRGRELGFHTMVGCMLESSLLIAAGAVIAQGTEFADLDGAWLLRDDPFVIAGQKAGISLQQGVLTPGMGPGFGVEPVADLFSGV